MPSLAQYTPPAALICAALHTSVCATSVNTELMHRADATRAAYFADVRRGVIAAAGECEQ